MPDDIFGVPLPDRERPSRKRQLADYHQRTADQRIQDCLDYPLLYEMAELLPASHMVGCPRAYPSIVYLLMAALTPVTKSKRSTAGLLTSASQWRSLRAGIRRHMGRRAAAALPLTAPTRGQYDYAVKTLLVPSIEPLEEEFRRYSAQQALGQGLFPASAPKMWSRPERRQLLVGDATVPRAPSKARKQETPDPVTGEVRTHRVDPAARDYYENGEKAKRHVRGTKWFFGSGRGDGYWTRVILTFAHVAGGEYEDEAAVAVRQFSQLKTALPDCMGVIYDGALRGVHRDALARRALLVINKQHGSVSPAFYERIKPCRSGHDLWCDQGRIAESVRIDDGTRVLRPVPITRLEPRIGVTKSRWYHLLRIPCRHGDHEYRVPVGITTTAEDRAMRDAATGRRIPSDHERGFHRAEYLQQIPQETLSHQMVYPYRSDSESVHSQFDLSLWNRRMIAYGVDRQKVFVLGFAISQNATSHQVFLEGRANAVMERLNTA
ncbi:hypothetical protein [Streptomyces sp. ADI98-10]|uniref:hypothetical protein n=1 Tax=Streptomyces sp. ADI98-10 TaxID=1522763 RepID=UPI000F54DBD3|nr:hypothetical protein [Streptomyces sp. ADI98-10]RPK82133.1 hypothetical protein EES46_27760 [Streptomyces sp. ADI98-10]